MDIVIYSKTNCSYCSFVRKILNENNIAYTEYKLDKDFTKDELLAKVPTAKTYPVIIIDGEFIGGFSDLKRILEDKHEI